MSLWVLPLRVDIVEASSAKIVSLPTSRRKSKKSGSRAFCYFLAVQKVRREKKFFSVTFFFL